MPTLALTSLFEALVRNKFVSLRLDSEVTSSSLFLKLRRFVIQANRGQQKDLVLGCWIDDIASIYLYQRACISRGGLYTD